MMAGSPTLKRVLENDLCSGCGLCAGVSDGAIEMGFDGRGFLKPIQSATLDPKAEEAIASACPGAVVAGWNRAAPNIDPCWGPWFESLTGHATDPDIRHAGASGGALSALAAHALATGLVDRVLHVEADPDQPIGNRMRWSYNVQEIVAGAGSRYSASSPLAEIREALDAGGQFAVIGKPCDISALRRYAEVDPRVDRHIPLMLSFFCGGMPSSHGADRILKAMGLEGEEIESFRYRGDGWPGLTVAQTRSGITRTMSYHDSWGEHLSNQLQFRCKICPDAVGAVADIACADAWYGDESGYPMFEEADGRSLLLSRTGRGHELLQSAMASGAVAAEPLAIKEIALMQPSQANRKRAVFARTLACRIVQRSVPDARGTEILRACASASILSQVRNFLGMLRRLVLRKAH